MYVGEIQFGIKSVSPCDTNKQLTKTFEGKNFCEFEVLWLFVKVFFAKFGGVASIVAQVSNSQKFSPWKSYEKVKNMIWTVKKMSNHRVQIITPSMPAHCRVKQLVVCLSSVCQQKLRTGLFKWFTMQIISFLGHV